MRFLYFMLIAFAIVEITQLWKLGEEGFECVSPDDAMRYQTMTPAERQAYEARQKPVCDGYTAKVKAVDKVMHAATQ